MTPNDKLPEEIKEQISSDADEYARTFSGTRSIKRPYIAGATAWAHWKVKYDEQCEELRQAQSSVKSLRYSLDQRDGQLKEMKDQAQRMADALEEIAESDCDVVKVNYSRARHSPECRACKARAILQQFKDGKEVENAD